MRKIIIALLAGIFCIASAEARRYGEPYRYYESGYGHAPVWHNTGLFDSHDLMNSMLYGAFGLKFDWVDMDGVRITTYGGYVEFCNIMLNLSYGREDIYEVYDSSASFFVPIHPNFRFGPRLEYISLNDKNGPSKGFFTHSKFNLGLTVDIHFKYMSIMGNISKNAFGIGIGWAFGRI